MDATIPLDDLALFVRVIEARSFTRAARELGLPTSTVSRAVARLEDRLGAQLVARTTRTLSPTCEGAALFQGAAEPLRALRELSRTAPFGREGPQGLLRVTAPNDLGAGFVADVVARFTARYPAVLVDVEFTARTVDLVAEGFDLALRAGTLKDSTLVARRVGALSAKLFASPSYLSLRGEPSAAAELASHECVLFRGKLGRAVWSFEGNGESVRMEVTGRISGDDFLFVQGAVRAGAGIGLLPAVLVREDVARGLLAPVLPHLRSRGGALHVVHPAAKHVPEKVTAFRDLVLDRYRALGDID